MQLIAEVDPTILSSNAPVCGENHGSNARGTNALGEGRGSKSSAHSLCNLLPGQSQDI